jgi:hypothetical protein
MRFFKKKGGDDFLHGNEEIQELKGFSIKDLLNGHLFSRLGTTRQWPLFGFMVFLAILYIGNRYHVEGLLDEQARLQKELKELKYEAITTSSELMNMSKQSEVVTRVRKAGIELDVLKTPPRKLEVKKSEGYR